MVAALDESGNAHVHGIGNSAHYAIGALVRSGVPVHFLRKLDRGAESNTDLPPGSTMPPEASLPGLGRNGTRGDTGRDWQCFSISRRCKRLLNEDARCAEHRRLPPLDQTRPGWAWRGTFLTFVR